MTSFIFKEDGVGYQKSTPRCKRNEYAHERIVLLIEKIPLGERPLFAFLLWRGFLRWTFCGLQMLQRLNGLLKCITPQSPVISIG